MRDINLIEERDFAELRRISQRLRMPYPEAFLKLEVTYKGKTTVAYDGRSHSWVRNAYNLLLGQLAAKDLDDSTFGAGKLSLKDTAGDVQYGAKGFSVGKNASANSYEGSGTAYIAAAADNTHGIQVGSGTNAESFEDYVLQTPIANGTGSGQLSYVLSEAPTKAYVSGSKTWTVTHVRYFNNNSGGNVSINEVGLITYGCFYSGNYKWLQSRDKLSSAVVVANTGQLKVTYAISLVYPS